jgi:hypothetical protein
MVVGVSSFYLVGTNSQRIDILMTYEEEILAKHSTDRLRRNILPREAKKLNMEFDENYRHMTMRERDELLDALYPEQKEVIDERPDADV